LRWLGIWLAGADSDEILIALRGRCVHVAILFSTSVAGVDAACAVDFYVDGPTFNSTSNHPQFPTAIT